MIAAVFDLDRTLLPGTTAERIFLRYLIRQRLLSGRAVAETLRFLWVTGIRSAVRRLRADRPYLTGLNEAVLKLHGKRCALGHIRTGLSESGVGTLRAHQERGHKTVMLSGSLPYVVEPLAEDLEMDFVICSRLTVRDRRLQGGLEGPHPYGEAKAALMEQLAVEQNIDLSVSYCYADHESDEALLEMFGHPVCVNPDHGLHLIAERRGWPIERFG